MSLQPPPVRPPDDEPESNAPERDWCRLIAESARDGIALADLKTRRLVKVNPTFRQMLGYGLDEPLDLTVQDLHPPQSRTHILAEFERISASGTARLRDIPILRKNGSIFYADVNASQVVYDGQPHLLGFFQDTSDYHNTALSLRDSEQRYARLHASMTDAYVLVGMDGRIKECNRAYREMLGYQEDELKSLTYVDITPDRWQAFEAQIVATQILPLGHSAVYEKEYRRKDGTIFPVELRTFLLKDDAGRPEAMWAIVRDISERRRTEEALRNSEALLRQAQRTASLGHYVLELGSDRWTSSETLNEIFGLAPEEPHTIAVWEEMLHPQDRDSMIAYFRDFVVGQRQPFDREYRIINRRDGSVRWLHGMGSLDLDENGRPLRMFGTIQDITDRRLVHETLMERERLLAGVINSAMDAIITTDEREQILLFNPAAEKMFRCPAATAIGHSLSRFIPERHRERHGAQMRAFGQTGASSRRMGHLGHVSGLRLDGEEFPIEAAISCVDLGEQKRFTVILRDISERKQLEERLRQSEKLTAIGQLAGGIAHDFNNQLAGIMGYSSLLLGRLEDGPLKQYAQGISVSTRRAADLTQQLLAFGRKGKYRSVSIDMHRLLAEVIAILERSIDKRIHISQVLKASHPVIQGDPTQLQNALLNLALNARDAMPEGGELGFTTDLHHHSASDSDARGLTPGTYLRIRVSDTGCGISPEVKKHLFEPFFTTKKVGEGSGMGLASVYGTVQSHQGSISVDTAPGSGSTFTLEFPLAPAPASTEEPATAPRPTRGKARILLVDDEPTVRKVTCDLLSELGHQVQTCADGQEAIQYYRQHEAEIDLVILDMVMPKISGHDTFLALRTINPHVRVLLSSGYSLDGEAQRILQEGVLAFLGKPYAVAELSKAVDEALQRTT